MFGREQDIKIKQMTEHKQWHEYPSEDWLLVQNTETDRVMTELYIDDMGQTRPNPADYVAQCMVSDLCCRRILKAKGSNKWKKQVKVYFERAWRFNNVILQENKKWGNFPQVSIN